MAASGRKYLLAVCMLTVSLVFFLFYPMITTSTVQVLAPCSNLCVDEAEPETCTKYLRADYSIQCDSPSHRQNYGWAMFCFLILGIGSPAVVMWQLRKRMAPIHHSSVRDKYRKRMHMYMRDNGQLNSDESDELRNEFSSAGVTIDEHNSMLVDLKAVYETARAAGTSANEYIAAENAIDPSSDPILLGISFFSISYKPQYYYWESIDLFRKLFVTSIVVYGSSCFCNSRSRALWWVLLSTILKNSIVPFHHAHAQVMC